MEPDGMGRVTSPCVGAEMPAKGRQASLGMLGDVSVRISSPRQFLGSWKPAHGRESQLQRLDFDAISCSKVLFGE
jgi:hypothetical protein